MNGSKKALSSLALLCGLGWLVMACPASLDDFCADGACAPRASAGEGGVDGAEGGADGGDGGPMTDPCIDNPTALACLDESKALFVSNPNGNDQDAAAGTKKNPFKTINAALAKIDAKRRRIYVCEGAYFEDLALNASHSSLSIFGGLDCAWNAAPAIKPVIGASANPLKIDGTAALAIADIAVVAKDAATGSSIAAFVNGGDTTFKRVKLSAGKGASGIAPPIVSLTYPTPAELIGNDAPVVNTGGAAKPFACPGGLITTGGKGGDLGQSGAAGTPGSSPNPGTLSNCTSDVNGHPGVQPPAQPGATKLGDLSKGGWSPMSGETGLVGAPGQGGGGGYGNSGGGGGGGAGGCGGAGGPGGGGGGASIALAANAAKVAVVNSILEAQEAGSGGPGSVGQAGQSTFGGGGNRKGLACNGGNGGPGADGSAGGGGAGGVSVGVLFKGVRPTADDTTIQSIVVGAKGAGGLAAPSANNAGLGGTAEAVLEIQ